MEESIAIEQRTRRFRNPRVIRLDAILGGLLALGLGITILAGVELYLRLAVPGVDVPRAAETQRALRGPEASALVAWVATARARRSRQARDGMTGAGPVLRRPPPRVG